MSKKTTQSISEDINKMALQSEIDRLNRALKEKDKEIEVIAKQNKRHIDIMANPFRLLREFVPDLDLDADGTFDVTTLTKEEYTNHLHDCWMFYNSLPVNREISALVSGLQTFALLLPETTPEGFKIARQCLIFVKGFVTRFESLAMLYDRETSKIKKPKKDSNTAIG